MTYFVLGSNSFAGSVFVNELLSRDEKVVGVSRSPQPHAALKPYDKNQNIRNFNFYQLDLNQDFAAIQKLLQQYKPEYVIDFASQSMVAESWINPDQWYTTNIVAKVKLHQFLKDCDFLQRYVRISTPEVFGHSDKKITEEQPFSPTTPYAVSQAATDLSLQAFYKQYGFPVLFTRFANFYGSYQQFYRIIPKAVICGLLGKKLPLHGGGTSKRAFIFGTDVASAIFATIKNGKVGESYHFSSDECLSIAELIQRIANLLGVGYENLVEIAAERPGKDFQYFMDTSKAERELSWQPSISLMTGLKYTIDWAKQYIDEIKLQPLHYIHKQ